MAVEVAALPDIIRGYEQIKLANVRVYHEKLADLRAAFAETTTPTPVP
ncbi:MAG: hypothetical protein ACRDNW_21840 [Trebonia sp.]